MAKGRRQKLKDGWEWDWVSLRARRFSRWKSRVGKSIKRRLNKRERKDVKKEIKESDT